MKNRDIPLSALPGTLALRYYPGREAKAARAMEGWVEALIEEAGGRLVFERAEIEGQPLLPSFSIATKGASSVHYHFVPEGPEMPVFRGFLWETAGQGNSEGPGPAESVQPAPPREMLLFVSTHCPNCPHAVHTVQALSRRITNLSAHLFEATLHADLAEVHGIQSVPTLLIDRELRYVGSLNEQKLFSILQGGNPESLLQEKIRQQIKGGSALEAAAWIAGGGDPSFLAPDLGRSTFEERIALLLALEEALESEPRCLDRIIDPLLPYLAAENASVRGDIADLLGKIGERKTLSALKRLLQDPDPNVVEAAAEAVDNIEAQGRTSPRISAPLLPVDRPSGTVYCGHWANDNEEPVQPHGKETQMADKSTRLAFTERTLQRWRMIQVISLLPLVVSVVLMLYFQGSMLGTIVFFLVLIVGVVLPQICRNVVESHLILLEEIEGLRKEISRQSG